MIEKIAIKHDELEQAIDDCYEHICSAYQRLQKEHYRHRTTYASDGPKKGENMICGRL